MSLPPIPKITQLLPGIIRILGMNPSPMTLQGTNSYLIGKIDSKSRMLIDTSSAHRPDYIDTVRQLIRDHSSDNPFTISDIIVTHWHPDHIGAVSDLLELFQSLGWARPIVHKFPSRSNPHSNCQQLQDGQIIDLSAFGMGELRVLHTPGHTDDHICLLLAPEHVLFSGDLILGHGSTTFEDLTQYMQSLKRIESLGESRTSLILPGHGLEILRPADKIREYIAHRLDRIRQVFDALVANQWRSEADTIVRVYSADVLDNPVLFHGAMKNQYESLKYLLHEKRVECRKFTAEEEKDDRDSLSGMMWRRAASANL